MPRGLSDLEGHQGEEGLPALRKPIESCTVGTGPPLPALQESSVELGGLQGLRCCTKGGNKVESPIIGQISRDRESPIMTHQTGRSSSLMAIEHYI